jgi:hypothetical protein
VSIVSQLIAAFKKGAEKKDPDWPPPNTGPRNVPGSDTPQDDGREFRKPDPGTTGVGSDGAPEVSANISGGGGGGGNTQPPPVGGGKPPVKAPDGPDSPSDPSPGGDDSPDPTPPSGPFDPGGVIFRTAGGDTNLNSGGVNPLVISRDRALGAAEDPDAGGEVARPRAPLEVKGENAGILEDPDAGGEVAAARGSLDAIDKGMKEAGEKADIAIAEDPDAGGEVTTGGGSAGIGIPEGHVPGGGGSAGIGIPEGHVPGGGSAGIGIPEGHVPGGEQAAGSNLGIDLPLAEGADQMVSAEPDPEPRRGNLLLEEEPEGGTSPGDGDGPRLVPGGQDPDGGDPEGEEILVPLGDRRGSQVGDPRDPEQIADSLADRLRGRLDSGLTGGLKLEGEYKVEGIGPAIASSDPEEGGELERPRAPLEVKGENIGIVEDPDAGGEVARPRAPLEVKGENSGIAEDPDAGGEVARPRAPLEIKGENSDIAEDPDAGGEVLSRLRPRPPVGQELPAGPLEEQLTPIDDGGEIAGRKADLDPAFMRRLRFNPDSEPTLQSADPEEGGEVVSRLRPRPPVGQEIPAGPLGEQVTPIDDGGEVTSLHRQVLDNSVASQIPRFGAAEMTDDPGDGGEATGLRRPPTSGYIGETEKNLDVASSDPEEGGEVFKDVKYKIEPAYLKFGDQKAELEYKPEGDFKGEGGIKFEGAKFDDTFRAETLAPPAAPGGVPLPYPNVDEGALVDDGGIVDAIGRKAGEGQKDFLAVKVQDVVVSSLGEGADPTDSPEADDDGLADALARKAGGGQQEYFNVKIEEVFVTSARPEGDTSENDEVPDDESPDDDESGIAGWIARGKGTKKGFGRQEMDEALEGQTSAEIDGESADDDHEGELAFARRTGVKDSHDKYANLENSAGDDLDDDDFESSSLLDLKPASATKEMLPGLAGELPDEAELELDFDDDLDDADESEL